MTRGQLQGCIGEHVTGPGAGRTRPQLRIEPELAVGCKLRLDQRAARIGLRRVIAATHVDFDIGEPTLGEVRFQLGERVRGGHIGYQAHVDLRHRLVRQHGLAARTGISTDQSFDVYRRFGLEQHQRIDPARIVDPVLHTQHLLHRALGGLGRVVPDHLLLRCGQRLRLLEKTVHGGGVAILLDQRVQCLHQVPAWGINLRLQARVHIVRGPPTPLLSARDQLELHHALGAQRHLHTAVAILARLRHEDPRALPELGQHFRRHDHFPEVRRCNLFFAFAHQDQVHG